MHPKLGKLKNIMTSKRWWTVVLGVTSLVILWNISIIAVNLLNEGNEVHLPYYVVMEITGAFSGLPLYLFVIWMGGSFPFTRTHWARTLGIHLLAFVLVAFLHTSLMTLGRIAVMKLLGWPPYDYGVLIYRYLFELHKQIIFYSLTIGLMALFRYIEKHREQRLRNAELKSFLKNAQLRALKSQLNPHFLFNTLNTISAFMYEDVRTADKIISRLSQMLRYALDHQDVQVTTLAKELEFLNLYVDIMKARFGERLLVELKIEPSCRRAKLPMLLLQPLVENAVKHNALELGKTLRVQVAAKKRGGRLHLTVQDNGRGFNGTLEQMRGRGLGIDNALSRLRELYGDRHRLTLSHPAEGGLALTLTLPFQMEPPAAKPSEVG